MYGDFIKSTLEAAGQLARQNWGRVNSQVKPEDNNQVLTEADIAIGKLIVDAIQVEYPDHNIIDEESGIVDNNSDTTWVVDPIDGTSNFAAKLPAYGCMIGVLHNDQPVAGGVILPAYSELYLAERGQGATCNGHPIRVSSQTDLLNSLVAYGIDGHQESPELTHREAKMIGEIVLHIRNLRASNSVYDFMMVAAGSYGAYLNQTSKIWDNVAPQIIIEEAGGVYTDYNGLPIDYRNALQRSEDNFTMCAGAPSLHAGLQRLISRSSDK